MTHAAKILLPAVVLLSAFGCVEREMGPVQAVGAFGEAARSNQGIQATQEPIEVSTDFTIGGAIEDAAAELRSFWQSQAPCNEVTRDGATTIIDWGELGDGCTWNGRSYAGLTEITVARTDAEELEVAHDWYGFHNEDVQVDGGAVVTWSAESMTRSVKTEHTWSRGDDTVDVEGAHVFGVRDRGSFSLDGTRTWTTDEGTWDLTIEGVGFRLIDPAPETGVYTVTDPQGRVLDVSFDRLDEDTIEAVLSGVRGGELVYHITGYGQYERVD